MPTYDNDDVKQLEFRVDELENRVTAVETKITTGFNDIKNLMQNFFQEKTEWGKFARESLKAIGSWCAKYGAIVICTAIGLGNLDKIIKIWSN